jgi:hypothetical protein
MGLNLSTSNMSQIFPIPIASKNKNRKGKDVSIKAPCHISIFLATHDAEIGMRRMAMICDMIIHASSFLDELCAPGGKCR